jgi:transposase
MATHYVARELAALGHDVKQVPPAYAKPFRRGHKNDFRDAYAVAKRTDVLSPGMVRIISDLAGDWRQLDDRIETVTDEIETLAKADDSCRRVITVPGIGPRNQSLHLIKNA